MATNMTGDGDVISVVATGAFTKNLVYPLSDCAGVLLNTGVTGDYMQIALSGVYTVVKKAGATLDFAVGEYVQTLTTGGVEKAVATGGSESLGIAMAAAVTGATTVSVKLDRW